ncbi:MarR family winged helix-turn-helix transcriptional regulator [Actinoalloteichus spitiensis]|uniref:MarR family winged helix-turn-helix transcriptional regulator n=1 Tax=Actinoalloteichus spitiensis TaxID=252394 RepID=UPI000376EFE2|nr:MarR family transcriptional regulator [Actinoalloteichus spitiensis]
MVPDSGQTENGRTDALYDALREQAMRAVLFHLDVANRVGISITDVGCLGVLDKEGAMSAGQLAERIGLSRGGAITAAVDRLERGGFVTRRRDTSDRRRVIVEIVRGGPYDRVVAALDSLSSAYRELIADYDDTETRLLLDFTRRANAVVTEHLTGQPPTGR